MIAFVIETTTVFRVEVALTISLFADTKRLLMTDDTDKGLTILSTWISFEAVLSAVIAKVFT